MFTSPSLELGLILGWPQVPVAPSSPAEIDLGDPTWICGAVTVSLGAPLFHGIKFPRGSRCRQARATVDGVRVGTVAFQSPVPLPGPTRLSLAGAKLGWVSAWFPFGNSCPALSSRWAGQVPPYFRRAVSPLALRLGVGFIGLGYWPGFSAWVFGLGFRLGFSAWVLSLGSQPGFSAWVLGLGS